MIDSLQRRAMVRPTVLSVYLRRDDASQMNNSNREPLLNPTQQQNPHDEETSISDEDYTSTKKKKVMIRIKSSCADSTIDDEDDDESVGVLQEDPFSCIRNHRWLSPSKTSAKALIYLLYATDLAVGVYLIAGAFLEKQKRDDYGYIMSRLTSGLLLTGSSFAGVCLHTPLGILLCDSDARTSRSLMVFNTSFAFIAVGIYYMLGISLLVSPLFTKRSDDLSQQEIVVQLFMSLLGFGLSTVEGYRILFIHYHYHADEQGPSEVRNTVASNV